MLVPAPATEAQRGTDLPRIGVLSFTQITPASQEALRAGLHDHGYVEKRSVLIEWRAAEGRVERAKALAHELVALKVDVIVAMLTPAVQAAKEATRTIPIVMAPAGDPLATGFVASLARPGGNITGLAGLGAELSGKRIDLLRELIPGLKRLGLLTNSADPFAKPFIEEHRLAARKAGVQFHIVDVRRPEDIDAALSSMAKEGASAVIVQGVLTGQNWRVGPLATRHGLPSTSNLRQFAESGGLLSYGASFTHIHRRAASYVDRILKGAKAAELPVEQPTQFELVINLKAARALGLAVPASVLVRADQVIE
jgi:putative ABC transport system substrate-binding protein